MRVLDETWQTISITLALNVNWNKKFRFLLTVSIVVWGERRELLFPFNGKFSD